MVQPLEELERIEQVWQQVIDSLNQAAQDIESAIDMVGKLFDSHKPHPALESAVKAIEGNVASATHAHNEVLAQIQAAKTDPNYLASHQE